MLHTDVGCIDVNTSRSIDAAECPTRSAKETKLQKRNSQGSIPKKLAIELNKIYHQNSSMLNYEVKSKRKNNAKLLPRDDTSGSSEGRSVVNTALEGYLNRVKIKTLNIS